MEVADIISRIESSGDQYAQRFERLHLGVSSPALLAVIMAANKCSQGTADVYAAMSHGLFQLMGFRLYGDQTRDKRNVGYRGRLIDYLMDADLQRKMFAQYCRAAAIDFTPSDLAGNAALREKFALEYNGPADVADYADRIRAACIALGLQVGE